MKKLYISSILFISLLPCQQSFSQCTCSDGSLPDSIVYHQYLDSIISTNTAITFPKFSDTMGELTCLRLSDTVTTVVNYNLENNLDAQEDYNFETYRRSQFSGPGGFFSSVLSPTKNYGPFTLEAYDPVGHEDEVEVGPDTVFNKNYYTKYFSGSSGFYGNGDVTLNYLTTSTFTILTGSDNAIIKLKAYTRLDVQLVYYWCPFSVLETNLRDFVVSVKDNNVVINWILDDPHPKDIYTIEMSRDGKNFINLGKGISEKSGSVIKSSFVFSPGKNVIGNFYFRIKQTDITGNSFYSEIRRAFIKNSDRPNISVYPNPVVSGINIQFANNAGCNYKVELFNSFGQLIFQKSYTISKAASVNIDLPQRPAPGNYFLRVSDIKNKSAQVEKLRIL
ncbi:MAG: T9SS type A sorting domain-containing protein [Ginsengibacter sp.]